MQPKTFVTGCNDCDTSKESSDQKEVERVANDHKQANPEHDVWTGWRVDDGLEEQ